jgi:uncharacterized membrane protein
VVLVSLVVELGPHLPEAVLRLFPASDPATARGAVRLPASSALTVATVTFPILIVVLAMTASSFPPRALSGVLRDRVDQHTLGMFLGAFAFGVGGILLLRPGPAPDDQHVLGLLLLITVIVAFPVPCAVVHFIHHTATAVRITHPVVRLYGEADDALARFLEHPEGETGQPKLPAAQPAEPPGAVDAQAAGQIQVLDRHRVPGLAVAHDVVVRVLRPTGDFATRGIAPCEAWPAARPTPELADGSRAACALGARRTYGRDPLLGMELLAEIAVRALSPGINDPNTAVNCLDFIGDLLVRIATHELPRQEMEDDEECLRVVVTAPDFRSFLERSLLGIAGAGVGHARVVLTLLRVLRDVASVTESRARSCAIEKAARSIADLALRKLAFERKREQVHEAMAKLDAVRAEPYG